jgi:hypothetical protein
MQFGVQGTTNPEEARNFIVAGLQQDSTGNEVSTYTAAKPLVVAPSTTNLTLPDATSKSTLRYGLSTHEIYYGSPKVDVGAIAFVNTLASYSNGSIVSGSQQVNVIPINGTTLGATPVATAQAIDTNLASSPVNPSGGTKLCFVSGGSNQSGLITIGGSARDLSVTLSVKENRTCT